MHLHFHSIFNLFTHLNVEVCMYVWQVRAPRYSSFFTINGTNNICIFTIFRINAAISVRNSQMKFGEKWWHSNCCSIVVGTSILPLRIYIHMYVYTYFLRGCRQSPYHNEYLMQLCNNACIQK